MTDVFTMLGDQPNRDALVREVSIKSEYLSQLEKQFTGASFVRTIKLFWAYETKTTRTVTVSERVLDIPVESLTQLIAFGWGQIQQIRARCCSGDARICHKWSLLR